MREQGLGVQGVRRLEPNEGPAAEAVIVDAFPFSAFGSSSGSACGVRLSPAPASLRLREVYHR